MRYGKVKPNLLDYPLSPGSSSIRQTVLSGKTDGSGYANFLRAGTGLSIDLLATETPLLLSFADGFSSSGPIDYIEQISADAVGAWSNLPANATSYLYVERNPSTGSLSFGAIQDSPYTGYNFASGQNAIPIMTSNTTPTGTASASSVFGNDSSYQPWRAFDRINNNQGIAWISGSHPSWIEYNFGASKKVYSYAIISRNGYVEEAPRDFKLQGWDGISYVDLDTRINETAWAANQKRVYSISTPGNYSRYRINISATNGGSYASIGDIEMYSRAKYNFIVPKMKLFWEINGVLQTKQILILGEAQIGATAISSLTSYELQGSYDSGIFAVSTASQSKNHNLGTDLIQPSIFLSAGHPTIVQATSKSISFTPSAAGTARILCRRAF